jgi:hypothetical protein
MKLNAATRNFSAQPTATVNKDGNLAFKLTPKTELLVRTATNLYGESTYYSKGEERSKELIQLAEKVAEKEPEFVFKLAAYTRQVLHLRTAPIVLYVVAANAKAAKGTQLTKVWTNPVIQRADEIAEAIAFQLTYKGAKKGFPNSMRRALGNAMNNFGAYNYGKYNRDGQVKLKDALRILHPTPKDEEQSKLYKKIIDGTLESPETWEVLISTKGSTKENWQKIAPKMGYMALMRNLRNFLQKECDMQEILKRIANKEQVLRSKQLPFRFLSAYREIEEVPSPFAGATMTALQKAMQYSVENVPKMPGVTVIAVDQSGSMDSPISEKSKVSLMDTAHCLAAIVNERSPLTVTVGFSDDAYFINIPKGSVMHSITELKKKCNPGGTNTEAVFDLLTAKKVRCDRVIILTDQQDNIGQAMDGWTKFMRVNPQAKTYCVDLAGHGTTQFLPGKNVVQLAGFSEKIFQFVNLVEQDTDSMAKEIEKWDYGKGKESGEHE